MSTVVIKGHGPHIRLTSTATATVKVVTSRGIRTVPVSHKGTDVVYKGAA